MAGDHKCSVCQATFTRPQHVARHMRSHTGDKPYKCQFCGDQFARSDLLSRHVNKCHPSETPIAGATTTRRKSASRATTSKQACDQCVQSTLPCDGSNPCSKCTQRNVQCTFVKFHRQTAPIGPGHNPTQFHSTSSRLAAYSPADDFTLGPTLPSIAPIHGDAMALPSYNVPFDLYVAHDAPPPSLAVPTEADYANYRSQADYIRRMSLPQSGAGVAPAASTMSQGWTSEISTQLGLGTDVSSFGYSSDSYSFNNARRLSVDFSSDSSAPSSPTSSSIHLPEMQQYASLEDLNENIKDILSTPSHSINADVQGLMGAQAQVDNSYLQRRDSRYSSLPTTDPGRNEGGFSSAFGLMSLDDPNVLGGFSTDAAPFFTINGMDMYPGDPDATPMPPKLPTKVASHANTVDSANTSMGGSLSPPDQKSAGSREEELRILKESWKMYLSMPLSSSTSNGVAFDDLSTTVSPGQSHRRTRVSSMPSVQTPSVERPGPLAANSTTSSRTTMHGNADDLRSYEAAVLARRAPLHLNLVTKRARGATTSSSISPSRGSFASLENGGTESMRPSFKRLPSQSLGPANAKRAMFDYDAGDDDSDAAGDESFTRRELYHRRNQQEQHIQQQQQQQQRTVQQKASQPAVDTEKDHGARLGFSQASMPPPSSFGGLAGRRRRMSVPDMCLAVPTPQLQDS